MSPFIPSLYLFLWCQEYLFSSSLSMLILPTWPPLPLPPLPLPLNHPLTLLALYLLLRYHSVPVRWTIENKKDIFYNVCLEHFSCCWNTFSNNSEFKANIGSKFLSHHFPHSRDQIDIKAQENNKWRKL